MLLKELTNRIRDFENCGAPDVVSDETGGEAAAELMVVACEALDEQ